MLTADSRTDLRPFHGHATAVERVGSNGGLARYQFTIEPWLAFLHYRKDSYAFHDATVIEIAEQIFGYYHQGVVAPAWRWELADRSVYVKRSLTSQYQESDFAFVTRLLAEEGIFYWFEHTGDPSGATLGQHTLVLADSNQAFDAGDAVDVRYHRANSTERDDSIQRWEPERRWQTGSVARASWDYRTLGLRPGGASASTPSVPATDDDTAGPYAWHDAAQGQYRAQQHLDARQVSSNLIEGAGSWRRMAPGQCLILTQHPTQSSDPLACLRVHHQARNNFDADVQSAIEQTLGRAFAHAPSSSPRPEPAPDSIRGRGPVSCLPAPTLLWLVMPALTLLWLVMPAQAGIQARQRGAPARRLAPTPTSTATPSPSIPVGGSGESGQSSSAATCAAVHARRASRS